MIRRYIHPAEPVYQVQPPRPMCGATRVHVGGDDVGLDLVGCGALRRPRMIDGIDHRRQLPGAVAVAERRECHRSPDRAVGVLAAVLSHAGNVALDVSGVERGRVERRIEKLDQAARRDEPAADRPSPSRCASAPDLAAPESTAQLCAMESIWHSSLLAEPSGDAVVEIGAPIPVAVPCVLFDRSPQLRRLGLAAVGKGAGRRANAPPRRSRRRTW